MKYTILIDCGELLTESREFATSEQALAYGQDLFDRSNAAFITIMDEKGSIIGDFEA